VEVAMALRVVNVVELRLQVLQEPDLTGDSVSEVCRRRELSRDTYYTYKRRFEARGVEGLEPWSRRPHRSPRQIPSGLEDVICRMRKDHPRWGARRIRAELERAGWTLIPAVSTIHQALRRNHLVADHPRKRPKAMKRFEREVPNDLWQIDSTRVHLADNSVVWVIDMLDDHARYLLAARCCRIPTTELAWGVFTEAAERCGLPRQVLSDNDLCFTGRFHRVKVAFELKVAAAGVHLINGRPYHPETQGKIERFHRTLKEWLHDHGPPRDLEQLQKLLDGFREHYNNSRPHQALGTNTTPGERYHPSVAELPDLDDEEPAYPAGAITRIVGKNGVFTYNNAKFGVGMRWAGRRVRIVDGGGLQQIYYGAVLIRSVALEPGRTFYSLGVRPPRR
jgi:transposase InsO family protein